MPLEGGFTLRGGVCSGRLRRPGVPPSGGGDKRGQGDQMVPLPPLDSPKPSFALTHRRCAAKRGKRGLGSVRRFAFGTLSGPEVSLRGLPRITVRGQTVQGVCLALRKAPLRSSVYPWSTKRPCGPLAFRRATEGSRVQRKVRGVKRGQETILGVLSPFAPVGGHRHSPPPGGGNAQSAHRQLSSPPPAAPLYRRKICRLLQVKYKNASPPAAGIIRA